MAWLSSVLIWDWDILVFWLMVAFSLVFLLVLLTTVIFGEDQRSCQDVKDVFILQQILHRKLLPIDTSMGWQLSGIYSNLRVWKRQLFLQNNSSFMLHGCSAILAGETEDILATMQNVTKHQEWNANVASISQSSTPKMLNDRDEDLPAFKDVIRITPSSQPRPPQTGILSRALAFCFTDVPLFAFFINAPSVNDDRKDTVIQRIWKIERDSSCWMFSRNTEQHRTSWCYFLIQPVVDVSGKSVIHYITSPSPDSTNSTMDREKQLAERLGALQDYLNHAQLKLRPLSYTSLQHVCDFLPDLTEEEEDDANSMQETHLREPCYALHKQGHSNGAGCPQEGKVSPGNLSSKTKKSTKKTTLPPGNKWKKAMPSRSRRSRMRFFAAGGSGGGANAGGTESSSSEDTGYSDWMSNKGSLERDGKAPPAMTSDPGVVTSMIDFMLGEREATSLKGGVSELYTLADQCVAELLSQSRQVAVIDINTNIAQQQAQTGGWFFHSLAKDVVILQKSPVQRKYHCFLGKGLIRASPEEVYKAVKNPRTRFIYDNMLKKMDIIKELDNNVQVVHAVHEVPQFVRKESRDFCLLQASKIESSTHVVAFTSASISECPPSESIIRSQVLPSGWVIEPVGNHREGPCSMVTYLVQISVAGKGVPASFIQFLSRRVPLSVAYLRMFIETEHM
ncbi:uncharacterized protein LOC117290700 isoform X1 [Asterias rubens]|uniref:uncharacterized protein LOC117290700 isoform X1 n=1 Tax=Asterias rubens TaxID=7604 RepID=UPI001455340D|nr:uncharacterized protein LOC117290700 isoform X1 [Asterias rubens]